MSVMLAIAFLLTARKPARNSFYAKEGLITVSLSWIIISCFGAMPFFSCAVPPLIDSLFEAVSSFTTTGSGILNDIEILVKSLLFWRSFTHLIGGMAS